MFSYENDKIIKKKALKIIFWILSVFISIYLTYDIFSDDTGKVKNNKIIFSHKLHSGKFVIRCSFCHYSANKESFSNIPTSYTCIVCHIALKNEKESLKEIINSYYNKNNITWDRINYLPNHSYFSHSKHLNSDIDCSNCHGNIEEMDSVKKMVNFTMRFCVDCHNNKYIKEIKRIRSITGFAIDSNYILKNKKFATKPFIGGYISDNSKAVNNQLANIYCSSCHR